MTTCTRMLPNPRYASGHTAEEFDQTQALRRLVGGPITTRPYWSMDDNRVQALESLRAQGLATVTDTLDSIVPKYSTRTYTATERALQIAAENEAARRPMDEVLAADPNWRVKVQNMMRRLRTAARSPAQRVFPDAEWMRGCVATAMQSPLWFSARDEETGELVFSSPELTRDYVAQSSAMKRSSRNEDQRIDRHP